MSNLVQLPLLACQGEMIHSSTIMEPHMSPLKHFFSIFSSFVGFRTSTRTAPGGPGPWAPLCFLFSVFALPPSRLGPLGPPTHREFHSLPPRAPETSTSGLHGHTLVRVALRSSSRKNQSPGCRNCRNWRTTVGTVGLLSDYCRTAVRLYCRTTVGAVGVFSDGCASWSLHPGSALKNKYSAKVHL